MSTLYIVLIVFAVVIALLFFVSCLMYFCHLCEREDGTNLDKRRSFISTKQSYDISEREPLNSTETTEFNDSIKLQSVNVKDKVNRFEHNDNSSWGGEISTPPQRSPPEVKKTQSTAASSNVNKLNETFPNHPYVFGQRSKSPEKFSASSEDISFKNLHKPAIAVKPTIHSLPSSKRNSLVRPTDAPPPPPSFVQPLQVQPLKPKISSIVKPKAPPPPLPAAGKDPPPSYNEIVYDTPDDYLSNN